MDDNNDVTDILNTEEEATPEVETEEETVETPEEESVDWKSEAEKAKELAENYKIRAEKAEKAEKKAKETVKESKTNVSLKESLAILNAKVHEEDIDEVLDFAKYKGISVSEALRSPVIKNTLAQRAEERQTAEATSVGRVRSGNARSTPESLYAKAQKTGELPDRDEDLESMLDARYQ